MSKEGVSVSSIMEISAMFPGFRFSPTDIELIIHYLKPKIEGSDSSKKVIAEVEICKFEPWDLPEKSIIQSDHEWFFFSPNDKRYPNGSQAKRATQVGFWKATGKERDIKSGKNVIGTKRTLVFHIGRSPKGTRTDWIIHEYCLKEKKNDKAQDSYVICCLRKKQDLATTSSSGEAGSQTSPSPDRCALYPAPRVCNDIQQISDTHQIPVGACLGVKDGTARSIDQDDWFADILKDDIVKLDYSQFYEAPLLPDVAESSAGQNLDLGVCSSDQGAVGRVTGLGRDDIGRNTENTPEVGDQASTEETEDVGRYDPGLCVVSGLAKYINILLRTHGWWISAIVVILLVSRFLVVPVL